MIIEQGKNNLSFFYLSASSQVQKNNLGPE